MFSLVAKLQTGSAFILFIYFVKAKEIRKKLNRRNKHIFHDKEGGFWKLRT